MKTHLLTISLFIFLVNGSLGQTTLSVAVSLNARTTKYEYSSPLNTQSLQKSTRVGWKSGSGQSQSYL